MYQDGVLYFIIEELPNPRNSGFFKILCGSTQIALDAVTLDEPAMLLPISSLACMRLAFTSFLINKLSMSILRLERRKKLTLAWLKLILQSSPTLLKPPSMRGILALSNDSLGVAISLSESNNDVLR